jgi:hypothetical protein
VTYDYVQAFTEGHSYNQLVAQYLNENGIKCCVPELQIAKNSAEIRQLTLTEKDIILEFSNGVLEVKSSRRSFGWDTENFPYSNMIVDTVDSYESKQQKPTAYILYSRPTGAMIAIGPSSKPRWQKRTFFDKYQKITDDFYVVDKTDIRPIGELIDYLSALQARAKNSPK